MDKLKVRVVILNGRYGNGEPLPPTSITEPARSLARARAALDVAIGEYRSAPRNSFAEGDARYRIKQHMALINILERYV